MNAKEQEKIIESLADTLLKTRAELDALRTLFIGTLAALSEPPERLENLPAALRAAIESDAAVSLNSPMPDPLLQQRQDWLKRLMSPQLQRRVLS